MYFDFMFIAVPLIFNENVSLNKQVFFIDKMFIIQHKHYLHVMFHIALTRK